MTSCSCRIFIQSRHLNSFTWTTFSITSTIWKILCVYSEHCSLYPIPVIYSALHYHHLCRVEQILLLLSFQVSYSSSDLEFSNSAFKWQPDKDKGENMRLIKLNEALLWNLFMNPEVTSSGIVLILCTYWFFVHLLGTGPFDGTGPVFTAV